MVVLVVDGVIIILFVVAGVCVENLVLMVVVIGVVDNVLVFVVDGGKVGFVTVIVGKTVFCLCGVRIRIISLI